jgi:5-methylcytosine-specific restriction protein A
MGRRERRPKREALTARQRNSIFEACNGVCSYCQGTVLYTEPWDVDHIVPVARGGTNDRANLTLACATCNRKKHIKAVA